VWNSPRETRIRGLGRRDGGYEPIWNQDIFEDRRYAVEGDVRRRRKLREDIASMGEGNLEMPNIVQGSRNGDVVVENGRVPDECNIVVS